MPERDEHTRYVIIMLTSFYDSDSSGNSNSNSDGNSSDNSNSNSDGNYR